MIMMPCGGAWSSLQVTGPAKFWHPARQVALGDSGEPSKRVPRYVREFSLGAQVPAGVGQLAGELGHDGSTGSVAIGVGYAQRHRGGGRKGAHLPGAWVNRSAMTHSAAGWLPMPKWLA